MNQKQERDKLFRDSRPHLRPIDIVNEDGTMGKDMGVMWAAYKRGSFPNHEEMSQEEFTEQFLSYISKYDFAWMAEDRNYHYPSGSGPVGLVVAKFDGWAIEPHFQPFSWATDRNKLRVIVSYFMMMRYEKNIGVVNVYCSEKDYDYFKRVGKRYGVLYFIGKFPRGDFGEDRYMFYGRGGSYFKGRRLWVA